MQKASLWKGEEAHLARFHSILGKSISRWRRWSCSQSHCSCDCSHFQYHGHRTLTSCQSSMLCEIMFQKPSAGLASPQSSSLHYSNKHGGIPLTSMKTFNRLGYRHIIRLQETLKLVISAIKFSTLHHAILRLGYLVCLLDFEVSW